jgi:hypothetical protein
MIVKCKLLFYVLNLLHIENVVFTEKYTPLSIACELQNGKHT